MKKRLRTAGLSFHFLFVAVYINCVAKTNIKFNTKNKKRLNVKIIKLKECIGY